MHSPVAGDPAEPFKGIRADSDVEMALPALLKSGVAAMTFTVIHHLKLARGKGVLQPIGDLSRL